MTNQTKRSGFTLVELAIVLVIIGLIIGGVLVGQDLIKAATVRAAVSQLEKYDTASNAFHNKYNGLPGDLANPVNFFPNVAGATGAAGMANGDGLIQATSATGGTLCTATPGQVCGGGEGGLFWYELNQAGLISDPIAIPSFAQAAVAVSDTTIPPSKLGKGGRVTIDSINGRNYYTISGVSSTTTFYLPTVGAGVTTIDAFNVDTKMDDGVPSTGKVLSVSATAPVSNVSANTAGGATACGSSATVYNNALYADTVNCNISIRTSF